MADECPPAGVSLIGDVPGRLVSESPGGRHVALADDDGVMVVDLLGGGMVSFPAAPEHAAYAIHPTGNSVAVLCDGVLRIHVADSGSWSTYESIIGRGHDTRPLLAFSMSGRSLFFLTRRDGQVVVAVLNWPSLALRAVVPVDAPWPPEDASMVAVGRGETEAVFVASNIGDGVAFCGTVEALGASATFRQADPYDIIEGERFMAMAPTPDGDLVVLDSDGSVVLVDPREGRRRYQFSAASPVSEMGISEALLLGPLAVVGAVVILVVYQYEDVGGPVRESSRGIASFAVADGGLVRWEPWPYGLWPESVHVTGSGVLAVSDDASTRLWRLP